MDAKHKCWIISFITTTIHYIYYLNVLYDLDQCILQVLLLYILLKWLSFYFFSDYVRDCGACLDLWQLFSSVHLHHTTSVASEDVLTHDLRVLLEFIFWPRHLCSTSLGLSTGEHGPATAGRCQTYTIFPF